MVKPAGGARHALLPVLAGVAVMLALAAGRVEAQGFRLPQQGFEATGQNPATYTAEEAEAASVILRWIQTTNDHDTPAHMALVGDNAAFRGDPREPLRRGARGYCAAFGFVGSTAWFGLDEMYLVGGPQDTLVLIKRTDINSPYNGSILGGYPVTLAVLVRVRNGRVVEWYDMPVNRVSIGALPFTLPIGGELNIPERCMPYPEGGADAPVAAASAGATVEPARTYGTNKPEYWFNPFEAAAAQTVRAWFAARQAGNPLLLGAFVDQGVKFRPDPADGLGEGRDGLLREVCGYIDQTADLSLTDLYVVGGDYDTGVLARWTSTDAAGTVTRMGSFFRVQNGLIVEWMDSAVDGPDPAARANPNSAACQAVNVALAANAAPPGGGRGGPPGAGRGGGPPVPAAP